MAKRIVVCPPVPLPNTKGEDGKPLENSMDEFLLMAINSYPPAGKTVEQIEETVKVVRKIKDSKGKEALLLEDSEHKLVFAAIDKGGWSEVKGGTDLAVLCWPFIAAVKDAKDPKEPDPPPAK